jgi:hypothetical protein
MHCFDPWKSSLPAVLVACLVLGCSSSKNNNRYDAAPTKDGSPTDAPIVNLPPDTAESDASADAAAADGGSDAALTDAVAADGSPDGTAGSTDAGADATVAALLPLESAWPFGGEFDTAVTWNNGFAYFFKGDQVIRYEVATNQAAAAVETSTAFANWPPDFAGGITGAAVWAGGKAYFFKAYRFARYDLASERIEDGFPQNVATEFHGLTDEFNASIDAVAIWPSGRAYLFSGRNYVRMDTATNQPDADFPKPLSTFVGYPAAWEKTTAVLVWAGGKAFLKNGDQYIRYDIATEKTDPGYPRAFR